MIVSQALGTISPCILSHLLEQAIDSDEELVMKEVAALVYAGMLRASQLVKVM